jgi:hypothetical protein
MFSFFVTDHKHAYKGTYVEYSNDLNLCEIPISKTFRKSGSFCAPKHNVRINNSSLA